MLEFTWPAFGFAVVNFLVLTALLWKFLHKPLLRTLDKRQASIEAERELAVSESQKAAAAKAEYEAKLKNAAAESDVLLAEARRTAEETKAKMLADAAEQAKRTITGLLQADERERREAQVTLQQSIVDSALNVAGTVLGKLSDDDIETKLMAQFLQSLDGLASTENAVAMDAAVPVTSAVELTDAQRADIQQRVERLGGRTARVEFAVDASLLAGARAEFSDRVVDASLADVLARVRETVTFSSTTESSGEAVS